MAFSGLNHWKTASILLVIMYRDIISIKSTKGGVPDKTRLLQYIVSVCGPAILCDQDLLRTHNISSVDAKYCSPCLPCFCDEYCSSLLDCCVDIQLNITSQRTDSTLTPSYACVSHVSGVLGPIIVNSVSPRSAAYPMIVECPENFTDLKMKQQCENPSSNDSLLMIPVTSAGNKMTYRNIECLKCSGGNQPLPWHLSLSRCSKNVQNVNILSAIDIVETALELSCDILFVPDRTSGFKRTCPLNDLIHTCKILVDDPNVAWACEHLNLKVDSTSRNMFCEGCSRISKPRDDTCNVSGDWLIYDETLITGCENGSVVQMTVQTSNFKNLHCHLCNEDSHKELHCPKKQKRPQVFMNNLFDMTSVFGSLEIGLDNSRTCRDGEVFDPYKEKCRNIFCPLGLYSKGDACAPVRLYGKFGYVLFFRLSPTVPLPCDTVCELLEDIQQAVYHKLFSQLGLRRISSVRSILQTFQQHNINASHINITRHADSSDNYKCTSNDIWVSMDMIIKSTSEERVANEEMLLKARTFTYTVIKEPNSTFTFEATVDDTAYSNFNSSSGQNDRCIVQTTDQLDNETPYVKVSELLVCRQIELEEYEYQVINDYSIFVPVLRATLTVSKFTLVGKRVRVCLAEYIDTTILSEPKTPLYIILYLTRVSIVFSNVSLFFSFITFLTYCIFPKYRTLPGKLIMCLAGVLFLAILFLELAYYLDDIDECAVMGILVHYFWLCFFVCMHSCCLQMYRNFCGTRLTRQSTGQENRRLKQYILYILGTPAILVSLTVITNVCLSGSTNYKSNGNHCFITEPISRGVAFILPVTLLIVWNVFLFLCTVRSVKSNPRLPNDDGYQHHVRCFIKLFTLTGLTWVLQLLDVSLEYTDATYSILSIVITVMNSSHGAFIFFAFTCNSRVYNSYKELILRIRQGCLPHPMSTVRQDTNTPNDNNQSEIQHSETKF